MSTDVDQQPETSTSEIISEDSKMLDSNAAIPSVEVNVNQKKRKLDDLEECEKVESKQAHVVPSSLLVEDDVGITEFISKHAGFSGIIKQRYSDFIVNEINMAGDIVRLTDLSCDSFIDNTSKDMQSTDSLTEEQISELKNLQELKDEKKEVSILVGDDKERRSRIHQAIKDSFSELDSTTVTKEGEKFIVVKYQVRRDVRKSNIWNKTNGEYCRFVLYKENKDTLDAVNLISKYLRIKTGTFAFAGTKDRRAKTSQEITAYRVEPSRLQNLNKCLRNIVLGNFRFSKEPLKLGQLQGNHFVIVLRNVSGSDEQIEAAMTSLKQVGFINYFGMQRFGTTQIPTHHVGSALLQSRWFDAIDLILKPRDGDKDEMAKAREVWQSTKNPRKTIAELKGYYCMERKLLEGLIKYPASDYVSALSMIPRNMRLMYIHAFQSYIWNKVVSRRISEFGLAPRIGDLALQGQPGSDDCDETVEHRDEPVLITAENISKFKISDLVLPLPGYDVRYPENETKEWYLELLRLNGMEGFTFKHKVRDYSLPGNYRKIIVCPDCLSWDIMHYDDYQQSLVLGDLEKLNNEMLPSDMKAGQFKALKLELSLPSSAYATMAIREVLKCGTTSAYQTSLNVT